MNGGYYRLLFSWSVCLKVYLTLLIWLDYCIRIVSGTGYKNLYLNGNKQDKFTFGLITAGLETSVRFGVNIPFKAIVKENSFCF